MRVGKMRVGEMRLARLEETSKTNAFSLGHGTYI